jgi:hypothetical protein
MISEDLQLKLSDIASKNEKKVIKIQAHVRGWLTRSRLVKPKLSNKLKKDPEGNSDQ